MNEAVKLMLQKYPKPNERALREIMQEVALVGLWRGHFFKEAAFYGGTALRILYGLDRFSEDLDFTLLEPRSNFHWDQYGTALTNELEAYGFTVTFEQKEKKRLGAVKSAFLKANTIHHLIKIGAGSGNVEGFHPDTQVRIKIEVDTDPPIHFETEERLLAQPAPITVRTVTLPGLFAGKMNAALFRGWRGRVKGRDWYDLIWYIRQKTPLSLSLFNDIGGNHYSEKELKELLHSTIDQMDMKSAINDTVIFFQDQELIRSTWSHDYFHRWIDELVITS